MGKISNAFLFVILVVLVTGVVFTYARRILNSSGIIISGEARPKVPLRNTPLNYSGIVEWIYLADGIKVALVDHAVYPGLGLALVDNRDNFIKWLPDAQLDYLGKGQLESAGEVLDWWRLEDFDGDNKKELAVQFGIAGTAMVHPFYLYSYRNDKNDFKLLLKLIHADSKTEIKDLDNDGVYEFVHTYSLSGIGKPERDLLRFKDIWRLENEETIAVNHQFPQEYQELIDLYTLALTKREWWPEVRPYYSVLRCLKEKAGRTMQEVQTDIQDCHTLLIATALQEPGKEE